MLQVLIVVTIGADICRNNNKISDHVVITTVNSVHSNTCDPSYVGQFVMSLTQSGGYKRCGDEVLRGIVVQMAIESFAKARAMIELSQNALPGRNDVDRHTINSVRISARKKRLALDSVNLKIDPKHFDSTFINSYTDTADNYTQGK